MSEDGESFYAPKSPDLSSYFSQPAPPPPPQPQVGQQPPTLSIPLPSPSLASAGGASSYRPPLTSPFTPHQYQPPTLGHYQPPSAATPSRSHFTPLTPGQGQQQGYFPPQTSASAYRPPQSFGGQEQYPALGTPINSRSSFSYPQQVHPEARQPPNPHPGPYLPGAVNANANATAQVHAPGVGGPSQPQGPITVSTAPQSPPTPGKMPPRKASQPAPAAPVIDPSPVKTKFPTARIKRIMQADEEVGKVAQQTPIAVGKALELFMIDMVTKSADVAKDKGQKRITAQMLKQVVETDDQFDFLRDIVSKIEAKEESSSKGQQRVKAETDSDEEVVEPKKRGRGGRKKRV